MDNTAATAATAAAATAVAAGAASAAYQVSMRVFKRLAEWRIHYWRRIRSFNKSMLAPIVVIYKAHFFAQRNRRCDPPPRLNISRF